jgi:hypothetical protein
VGSCSVSEREKHSGPPATRRRPKLVLLHGGA